MLRSLLTVSGFTLISRILGFIRDMLMMQLLGVSKTTDAFYAAFRFPNMFRRIFGEGAYNAAFVPLFGRKLEQEGREEAVKFARNTFSSLLLALGLVTVVAIPCMHWIMAIVVPGFLPKFEKELGGLEVGTATYPVAVDIRGARDLYLQVHSGDDAVVSRWAKHITLKEAWVETGKKDAVLETGLTPSGPLEYDGLTCSKIKLRAGPGGTEREVVPGETFHPGEGEEVCGAEFVMEGGMARIRLPEDHRFDKFVARLQIALPTDGEKIGEASLRVYRNHPDTFFLTVQMSRIMFCYLLFMALAAHLSGVLNTFKIFGMPAAAPIILNVTLLVALTMIWTLGYLPGTTLAWAVAIAGFLQFGALWVTCARHKAAMVVAKPTWDRDLKRLLFLMGPGVAAAGVQQVNLLVGGIIASFQEGAISLIYVAERVYQLPLGMIGIALGVVLLPEVTRRLRSGREREAADSILKGMELAMLLTVPAAVAMMVIPVEIISALFERGKFDAADSQGTGWALAGFALGLPGYVLVKVLQPGYFAREDTKSPMIIAAVAVVVNIVCSIVLFSLLRPTGHGHVGIAIATSISAWVNVILLWRGLRGFVNIPARERRKLLMILVASLLMGALVWLGARGLQAWFEGTWWLKLLALVLVVGAGVVTYAFLALFLRATTLAELRAGLGRSASK